MLGTSLFVLCATALAHADLPDSELDGFFENGCPKDTSIQKLLPHEDCQQFYNCFHGTLIARYCPNGLYFNIVLEKCDWISKTDCHKKHVRLPSSNELNKSDPRQVNLICASPDSNGVLVAHRNCHQFYKCLDNGKVVLNCAKDLLYNTVTETCDWPQNVKCGRRLRDVDEKATVRTTTNKVFGFSYSIEDIDQSNADPSQAIAQCSSKRSDGVLVAHENCNMFYKCSGGVPVTMKCPSNLLYNPIKELCDWPGNVDCDDRSIPELDDISKGPSVDKNNEDSDDYQSTAIDLCAAESSDGILLAHEKCNHFFKCLGGKPSAYSCPGDLLFNSKKSYCDWPKKVDCGERSENEVSFEEQRTEDPKQALDICAAENSDGVLVAHESCNQFYKCHDGFPVVVQCPGNLLYRIKEEMCDWPTHVNCKDRTVADNVRTLKEDDENNDNSRLEKVTKKFTMRNLYPKKNQLKDVSGYNYYIDFGNVAETCADESFDGKFLPHENCNQFYICSDSKAVAFFCPLNLVYNIQKVFCDFPNNVMCGNRLRPLNIGGEDKNKHVSSPCHGKLDGTILPHENCSQFYKCSNGTKYPLDCPAGLYFNSLLIVCDWPMNVDCGERLTEAQLKSEPV